MSSPKMHADEIEIDILLVRRLLASQFPHWSKLPIERVGSDGTDNAMFRLGGDMAVRLPRYPAAAAQVTKEQQWLPRLAPLLTLAIPVPLACGVPDETYPWRWSICRWLEGEHPVWNQLTDPLRTASELAQFILSLRRIDPAGGPPPGVHNFGRGELLMRRDGITRKSIASLHGSIDTEAVTAAWNTDVQAPAWAGAPMWIHGDLSASNLLMARGRLTGVIDFGGLGVGDPACDLLVAWSLFSREAREMFRQSLDVDDASWARGRGWALAIALVAMPYYKVTNPALVVRARRVIDAVLADHRDGV